MKATLAKIRKSSQDASDGTFNKQIAPKKQNKKSPSKIQEARSFLSSGLFYRQNQHQKEILPSKTSSEKEQQEVECELEQREKRKQQKEKRINRFTKF